MGLNDQDSEYDFETTLRAEQAGKGSYAPKHVCIYKLIRMSVKKTLQGVTFVQACRCGAMCQVDCNYQYQASKTPAQTRTWINSDGTIVRVSGGQKVEKPI